MSFSLKNPSGSYRAQSGLSLIELMIALALGLVLTLGVVQVFLGSSQTYRLGDSLGKVQENIRFTLGTLSYDSRMAGHFGCLIGEPSNQLDESDGGYDELVYEGPAIVGWDADGTGLGDSFTVTTLEAGTGDWGNGSGEDIPDAIEDEMLPGTDFFIVSGGEGQDVQLSATNPQNGNALNADDETGIEQGKIVLVVAGDCSGADLFQKTNQASASSLSKGVGAGGDIPGNKNTSGYEGSYDEDAQFYEFKSTAYFIGEGASGEPALFRERLDAGDSSGAVELAEGVENMQILYGVSSGVERRADSYFTAANVTNWDNVVSVRMALLFRTGDIITDEEEVRELNLAGTEITTQSDRRARVVGLSTVGIRNRLE